MSTAEDELSRIADEAALWLVEAEEDLDAERQREFSRWLKADPRHAAAIRRLQWGQSIMKKIPEIHDVVEPVPSYSHPAPSVAVPQRRRIGWPYLLAACAAVAVVAAIGWFRNSSQLSAGTAYACAVGSYQRVALEDGSILELNEKTRVRVDFSRKARRVELEEGEALFTVAKDAGRPFVVEAEGVVVRAIGTAFRVRRAGDSVDVLVTEGRVSIGDTADSSAVALTGGQQSGAGVASMLEVGAGERTLIRGGRAWSARSRPTVEKVAPQTMRQTLDWQERKLFFADAPLWEVVQQFNRRNRLQIVIIDQDLAARPVGGSFAADNVEGFIRLLESSGVVSTERRGEWEIALRARSGGRD